MAPAGYQVLVAAIALVVIIRWLPETAGRNIAADHPADEDDANGVAGKDLSAGPLGSKGLR